MNLDEDLIREEESPQLSDREIFTEIWTSPRKVFKYINDNSYDKFLYILLILAGISRAFDQASTKGLGEIMSLGAVLAICIVLGALLGWISFYIYAALLSWTGKWIEAKGNTDSLLRMSAYAMIPSIAAMILVIPQIILFGNEIFKNEMDIYSSGDIGEVSFYIFVLFEVILGLWTIVLFVIGVSEVQKISIGKSILNLLLPLLVIFIPIAMIAFLLGDLLT